MRSILLIAFSVFCCQHLLAQDVMDFTDKTTLDTKVLEVLETTIKYKRFDNPDGPTYTVSKSKVYRITYHNGVIENYTKMPATKAAEPKTIAPKKEVAAVKEKAEVPKKPAFTKYTPAQYEAERQKMYAERTQAPLPDTPLYKYALLQVPNIPVYTPGNEKVKLYDYLKSKPGFSNKPTLIITWAWTWCGPCVNMIDTLVSQYESIKDKFNIVLINRGEILRDRINKTSVSLKEKSIDKARTLLLNNDRSDWYSKCTMLFDYNSEMQKYDEGSTPLLLWVDKNLVIRSTVLGYAISIEDVKKAVEYSVKTFAMGGEYFADFKITEHGLYPAAEEDRSRRMIRRLIGDNIIELKCMSTDNESLMYTEYYYTIDSDNNIFPLR